MTLPRPRHACSACGSTWLAFSYHAPSDQLRVTCGCGQTWFVRPSAVPVHAGLQPLVATKGGGP